MCITFILFCSLSHSLCGSQTDTQTHARRHAHRRCRTLAPRMCICAVLFNSFAWQFSQTQTDRPPLQLHNHNGILFVSKAGRQAANDSGQNIHWKLKRIVCYFFCALFPSQCACVWESLRIVDMTLFKFISICFLFLEFQQIFHTKPRSHWFFPRTIYSFSKQLFNAIFASFSSQLLANDWAKKKQSEFWFWRNFM